MPLNDQEGEFRIREHRRQRAVLNKPFAKAAAPRDNARLAAAAAMSVVTARYKFFGPQSLDRSFE
ncbi:MAG: hypothetical protein ABIP49_09185 [Lysobacterales bacterium]